MKLPVLQQLGERFDRLGVFRRGERPDFKSPTPKSLVLCRPSVEGRCTSTIWIVPNPSMMARRHLHAFTNGQLDETCQIVNPVLQGADGSATRSAGQGARDTADGSSVLSGASRSQPQGRTGTAVSKPRGETMIEIRAGMRSCRSAMLQPCLSASCKGHPRILPGSVRNPSTSAGVA